MTGRVTDRDWLLAVLSDGKPHTHAEILRRSVDERGHGLTPHSRAADLRKLGHDVQVTTWRENGRVLSSYQLVSRVEPQPVPPLGDDGEDGCGSTDETALSSQPMLAATFGAGRSAGVGCEEGDGQLALIAPPANGAYRRAA